MKSKLHNLIDKLMEAIIPAIAAEKSYDTILAAFGCVNARIAMAAPDKPELVSKENAALHQLEQYSRNALTEFLKLEQEQAAKEALVDKGIDGFAELFRERPDLGLAALNGGMGAEAQAAAKEAQEAGPFTGQVAEGGAPGEFGYKVIDGVESPAGRTLEEIQEEEPQGNEAPDVYGESMRQQIEAEEAEQARLDTHKETE